MFQQLLGNHRIAEFDQCPVQGARRTIDAEI
jgi:hypothetical protein